MGRRGAWVSRLRLAAIRYGEAPLQAGVAQREVRLNGGANGWPIAQHGARI